MFRYLTFAIVVLLGCTKQSTDALVSPGAATEVWGVGTVTVGENAGNLVITPDDGSDSYCLQEDATSKFNTGDRVRFNGKRTAALALAGESCLKLELTSIEPL